MKKLTMTVVILFVVTAFAAAAFAFGPGWGRGHGGGYCNGPNDAAFSNLKLTAEQTAMINSLREAHLKDVKPLQDKMFSKRGELRLLWLQQNPDQEKIIAAQKEIRVLRDQLQDKRDNYRLQMYNVLSPEQKTQYQPFQRGGGYGPGSRSGGGFYGRGPSMGGGGGWQGGPCYYNYNSGSGMMRGNW